ncbi:hypothetical protein CB0940_11875 [Cercospora beticola]|uniref:Uncharacterized protein n=1 Tax=Cercospora beticola TaxID=122368 RepID=A0A2G5IED0_CERBT|nr:hypothetical protein CB0940_11875 [Cercospora beticola]PIB03012.1 hypothetical protein CB0940_11875 [Cercospora beticola]WPB04235.1 hypothetical protein RHO25_008880 [Cercospora beticola]
MFFLAAVSSLLLASKTMATGLPSLPARTVLAADKLGAREWSPGPTHPPAFLPRRQSDELSPLCGYAEGDAAMAIQCTGGEFCGFNLTYNAFGCCSSVVAAEEQLLGECGYYTTCLDFEEPCDAACQANKDIYRCTESAFPKCVKYEFAIEGATLTNYGCADTVASPTEVLQVLSTTVAGGGAGASGAASSGSTGLDSLIENLLSIPSAIDAVPSQLPSGILTSAATTPTDSVSRSVTRTQGTADTSGGSSAQQTGESSSSQAEDSAATAVGPKAAAVAGALFYASIWALARVL